MSRRAATRAVFLSAITLLCLCGLATFLSFSYFRDSTHWVTHSQEVRGVLGDLEAAVNSAGRSQMTYLVSGAQQDLSEYRGADANLLSGIDHLEGLTKDSSVQRKNSEDLAAVISERRKVWAESIRQKQRGEEIDVQAAMQKNIRFAADGAAVAQNIRNEEAQLLVQGTQSAHRRFVFALWVVTLSFGLAIFLLFLHYRWLSSELRAREHAEEVLAGSERSLRELSLHLLRSQDEERRRIGRDLHDSLGQSLAALKLNLDTLQSALDTESRGTSRQILECARLAEEAVREVRTISYLLYPPMLEELGLKSAIGWYLDGFSKRSGIQTTFDIDSKFGRLAPDIELALFRILQEALTNVHRHSGSGTARIRLSAADGIAALEIEDEGKGIPADMLQDANGHEIGSAGVGLRGMSERVGQFGGRLNITATNSGTIIRASLPATARPAPAAF